MNKKMGFTIIEVIIAMAIFAIVTASISLAVNASCNLYRQENVKFQTISAADSILHQLKAKGIEEKSFNSEGGTISSSITSLSNFFEYTIGNAASARNDKSTTRRVDSYIYFNYDSTSDLSTIPLNYNNYHLSSVADSGNYVDCKNLRTTGKDFGALVSITRDLTDATNSSKYDPQGNLNISWYYNIYTIYVTVWNFNEGENSKAVTTASISR